MEQLGSWQAAMKDALALYLAEEVEPYTGAAHTHHLTNTPERVVRALKALAGGYHQSVSALLQAGTFPSSANQMVHVQRIRIVSVCAHHIQPIIGDVHFAYVPDGAVVGLSKIPRFIQMLARRLQIQEVLTEEIADAFMGAMSPAGVGVSIRAYHCCMMARGVMEHEAFTTTTVLRGSMLHGQQRDEFMAQLDRGEFRI